MSCLDDLRGQPRLPRALSFLRSTPSINKSRRYHPRDNARAATDGAGRDQCEGLFGPADAPVGASAPSNSNFPKLPNRQCRSAKAGRRACDPRISTREERSVTALSFPEHSPVRSAQLVPARRVRSMFSRPAIARGAESAGHRAWPQIINDNQWAFLVAARAASISPGVASVPVLVKDSWPTVSVSTGHPAKSGKIRKIRSSNGHTSSTGDQIPDRHAREGQATDNPARRPHRPHREDACAKRVSQAGQYSFSIKHKSDLL